jgi:hypothetical protein
MQWKKQGLVYVPDGRRWWARSYAAIPTAEVRGDTIRIYFTSLDENRFGRIGYLELDAGNPSRIVGESVEPILDLGPPGVFDDSGVNASCVLTRDDETYLYYIGWQRCERVPYMLFTGLARSKNGGPFVRASATPILDRDSREPFLRSAPVVLPHNHGFRAWYVSGLGWVDVNDVHHPTYVVRYADSIDGVSWTSHDRICIDFKTPDEYGFGRPWVISDGGLYKMWYSIRSRKAPYCIGYAESTDGINWSRLDHLAGIHRSESGWDSEMICYPCVVDAGGQRYMFYNGNRHGSTGFGYAVLQA